MEQTENGSRREKCFYCSEQVFLDFGSLYNPAQEQLVLGNLLQLLCLDPPTEGALPNLFTSF